MALKTAPTDIGFAQITLSAMNAVATSESPFTYKQQITLYKNFKINFLYMIVC